MHGPPKLPDRFVGKLGPQWRDGKWYLDAKVKNRWVPGVLVINGDREVIGIRHLGDRLFKVPLSLGALDGGPGRSWKVPFSLEEIEDVERTSFGRRLAANLIALLLCVATGSATALAAAAHFTNLGPWLLPIPFLLFPLSPVPFVCYPRAFNVSFKREFFVLIMLFYGLNVLLLIRFVQVRTR